MPAMAAESAANASDIRSTRKSIAMPLSCEDDHAPYDSSRVPTPVAASTTNAADSAAHATSIELAASLLVHRSGSGRLTIAAPPSNANRSAGDPTPTSTIAASGDRKSVG